MTILQILLAIGSFGILGFGFYWFAVIFKAAPDTTKDEINNDPKYKNLP